MESYGAQALAPGASGGKGGKGGGGGLGGLGGGGEGGAPTVYTIFPAHEYPAIHPSKSVYEPDAVATYVRGYPLTYEPDAYV